MTYTGNSILKGVLGIVSYYLVFIFLDEMMKRIINSFTSKNNPTTAMLTPLSNLRSTYTFSAT
jgi:hypothetical protein